MSTKKIKIHVSVDIEDILEHLEFLQFIDQNGQNQFYDPNFVRNSIRRYETCWLPLITKLSDNFEDDLKFAPPPDVEWIWLVHMLAPVVYQRDLTRNFGRQINHQTNDTQCIVYCSLAFEFKQN